MSAAAVMPTSSGKVETQRHEVIRVMKTSRFHSTRGRQENRVGGGMMSLRQCEGVEKVCWHVLWA